jgi:hypothetical protein
MECLAILCDCVIHIDRYIHKYINRYAHPCLFVKLFLFQIQRRATAMTAELKLLSERLVVAEKELEKVQEEAKDFLEAKRKDDIRARRTERALETITREDKKAAQEKAKVFAKRQSMVSWQIFHFNNR